MSDRVWLVLEWGTDSGCEKSAYFSAAHSLIFGFATCGDGSSDNFAEFDFQYSTLKWRTEDFCSEHERRGRIRTRRASPPDGREESAQLNPDSSGRTQQNDQTYGG